MARGAAGCSARAVARPPKNGCVCSRRLVQNGRAHRPAPRRRRALRHASSVASEPSNRRYSWPSHQQLAVSGRAPRARSASRASALRLVDLERQRALAGRLRQHLERHVEQHAEDAQRAGHQSRDVVAGDVLHHLAAEAQHAAVAGQHARAEHEVAQRTRPGARRAGESRRDRAAERRVARRSAAARTAAAGRCPRAAPRLRRAACRRARSAPARPGRAGGCRRVRASPAASPPTARP